MLGIIVSLLLTIAWACDKLDQLDVPNSYINLQETVDARVDSLLLDEMEQQDLAGMAVGIYDNDKLVHLKAYGYADWVNQTPWEIDTRCHWASISKSMTAVAAFKLIEDGHMSLNETVSDSLPNWPQSGRHANITIGQLLANTSGITHYDGTHNWSAYTNTSTTFFDGSQGVQMVDTTLLFNPGNRYDYSTFGWNLAGAYIAAKARTAYDVGDYVEFVEEVVATPMSLTSLEPTDNLANRVRSSIKNCNFEMVPDAIPNVVNILPGGGWSSTIGDLMLFGKGLMEEEFLTLGTMNTMWTIQGWNSNYAYGWNVAGSGSNRLVYHTGSKNGFKTMLAYYPDLDITIAIMTNSIRDGDHLFRLFNLIADVRGYSDPLFQRPKYTMSDDINCDTVTNCLNQSTIALSGVWRTGNSDQLIRRGLRSTAFGNERLALQQVGYEVTDLETYLVAGEPYYDGVFTRQPERTRMWRGWKDDDFFDKFQDEVQNGYRLFDIEVSIRNGERYWSGLFEPGAGGYGLYRFVRDDALMDSVQSLGNRGFRLIDLEPYMDGSTLRWATVWRADGQQHEVVTGENFNDFNASWTDLGNQGYSLIDVERYRDANNVIKYAGVFSSDNSAGALYRNNDVCVFINRFETLQAAGRQLVDLEVHP